jgi:hypothetical protein
MLPRSIGGPARCLGFIFASFLLARGFGQRCDCSPVQVQTAFSSLRRRSPDLRALAFLVRVRPSEQGHHCVSQQAAAHSASNTVRGLTLNRSEIHVEGYFDS